MLLESRVFFVDRSLGRTVGLGLRKNGLRIELHGDHFPDDVPDEVWLREIGARGWVALGKDKGISRRKMEREALIAAKVAMFSLSHGNVTGQQMLEIFLKNKLGMARFLAKYPPPFVANISLTGIRLILPRPTRPD